MVSITIYVEGGGSRALNADLREGFRAFLEKGGLSGRLPTCVACGPRSKAYKNFCRALGGVKQDDRALLLVDSEGPIPEGQPVWKYLSDRKDDAWEEPDRATEGDVHLMVQCMEAWFLADVQALSDYFGQGFRRAALPGNPNLEQVQKADIQRGLKAATHASSKGAYDKGKHSFAVLGRLDPAKVRAASAYCERLFVTLDSVTSP